MSEYLNRLIPKMELPASVVLALFGGCLFVNVITAIELPKIYHDLMIAYVALNSVVAPFMLTKRFVTPKISNPKCHFCGVFMDTVKLKCPKCGRIAGDEK